MTRPARRVALCGVLTALMLILGYVEQLLPLSAALPGVKLGLSNAVLLFALYTLDMPTALMLMVLKVLLTSALFAGFGAAPYAFAGGLMSLCVMALLRRMKGISPVTVSMAGGAMHSAAQVLLAMVITRTPGLVGYMGLTMLLGLVCGLLTGIAAALTLRHLRHLST